MLINARFLTQRITGVQRFAREVVQTSVDAGLWSPANAGLVSPRFSDMPEHFAGLPLRAAGRRGGHAWEQFELPAAAGDQLLLNLCNTAPILRRRQFVMLHDAAVAALPSNFTPAFRLWYQVMIRSYTRFSARIGTISRFSASEISKHFGVDARKIEIIPLSGEHILREEPDYSLHRQYGLEKDGYFLAVSSHAPHKNFSGVLKAIARLPDLPFKFVVVGGRNSRIFSSADIDMNGAVEVGYVSDAQLRALYDRAACFIYPSTYEGFGLPPMEAMSCGCPVLVAKATSLPEVCGDGAAYCDPFDPDDIAKQLSLILSSRAARDNLRAAGTARARQWTWEKAARRLNDILP